MRRYSTFENDKLLFESAKNKNSTTWHILTLIVSLLVICSIVFSCYTTRDVNNAQDKISIRATAKLDQNPTLLESQDLSSIYPQIIPHNYTHESNFISARNMNANNDANDDILRKFNPFYLNVSLLINKTIYIIRHCEKSRNKDMGLNELGLKHAVCLVPYFKNFPMGSPKILYGAISRTMRSVFTLIPISVELKLPLYGSWKSNDIRDGIYDIYEYLLQYDTILIAWEHRMIPHLATALRCTKCNGWNKYSPSFKKIDDNLYNMTWVLRYNGSSPTLYTFGQNFHAEKCIDNFTYTFTKYDL